MPIEQNSEGAFLDAISDVAHAVVPEGSIIVSGMVYFRILDAEGNSTFVWKEWGARHEQP